MMSRNIFLIYFFKRISINLLQTSASYQRNINIMIKTQKLCIVTTLRTTPNKTLDFINYHINIGVDHLYLFFDNPNDYAISISQSPYTTCIPCDDTHWKSIGCTSSSSIELRQEGNANLALEWAKLKGYSWISHIDCDELLYSQKNIISILQETNQNIDYLVALSKESVPEKLQYRSPFKEITLFKSLTNASDQFSQENTDNDAFFEGEFFRGHTQGKSIVRITNKLKSLKIHKPEFLTNKPAIKSISEQILLLHFDCYDYTSWSEKWQRRIEHQAIANNCRNNRLLQKEYYKKAKHHNNIIDAYMKLYFLSKASKKELFKKHMLIRININQNLFQPRTNHRHE